MNDLLSVDEMARVLNLVESGLQVVVPGVEFLVGELTVLVDGHDAFESVDLCFDPSIHHHVAKLILSSLN